MTIIEKIFSDTETVKILLYDARKVFTDPKTTREQYYAMKEGLSLAQLYCPENLQLSVKAVLSEAEIRKTLYFDSVWENNGWDI